MSSLFQKQAPPLTHLGTIDLNQLHSFVKSQENDVERCVEASFLNNDKKQTTKLISSALSDIVKSKRKLKK